MKQMKHKRLECPFSNVEHFKSIGLIDEKWKGGWAFEVFWTSETITQAPDVV